MTLYIPFASWQKIMWYTEIATQEISGFADVEYNAEAGRFEVGNVYLVKQECTATETEMDDEAIADFNYQLVKDHGMTQLPRLWWHSHVNMGAFLSGTDEDTLAKFKNDSWMISLVVNKRAESKVKIRQFAPFDAVNEKIEVEIGEHQETIIPEVVVDRFKASLLRYLPEGSLSTDIEIDITIPEPKIPDEILAEVAEKVTAKTYNTGYAWNSGKKNNYDQRTFINPTRDIDDETDEDPAAIYLGSGQGSSIQESYFGEDRMLAKIARQLPRKRKKAEKIINSLGLRRETNYFTNKNMFISKDRKTVYMDYHETMGKVEGFNDVRLKD